ncbi:MAG: hypothetical protein JW891_10590 [Candidatus Lokiarchaeota archaeon]|nr:hypothetical protein [Candidatus Lokiarchaeota archaeon]
MVIESLNDWLQFTNLILRLLIAISLIYVAHKSDQKPFFYLALNFMLLGLSYLPSIIVLLTDKGTDFPSGLTIYGLGMFSYLPTILFLYLVFFQERKGAKRGLWILAIMWLLFILLSIYCQFLGSIYPSGTPGINGHIGSASRVASLLFFGILLITVSTVLAIAMIEALVRIAKSKMVKLWVKGRYLAVIIVRIIYFAVGVNMIYILTDPFNADFTQFNTDITYWLTLSAIIIDFIAWVLPTIVSRLMSIFSKKERVSPEEEMTEEEIMKELSKGGN